MTSDSLSFDFCLPNLENYRVTNIPKDLFYIPNVISKEEEELIIANVNGAPKPKWTQLSNRRLQNWGGVPHPKGMIAEPIPPWLQKYVDRVQSAFCPVAKPNHVLVNEYTPGQGILAHTDGPLFFPVICTISCGSHTVLNFHKMNDQSIAHQIFVEPRSLVIITSELYSNYLHSISEVTEDIVSSNIANLSLLGSLYKDGEIVSRKTRISLTIRHVPFTTKFKLRLSK